jgi:serine/threonine protein kinase
MLIINQNRSPVVTEFFSKGEDVPNCALTSKVIWVWGISLYSKSIFRTDVKPGDIVLSTQYESKVADFGLSKVLTRNKVVQTM